MKYMEFEYKYRLSREFNFTEFRALVDTFLRPSNPCYGSHWGISSVDCYFSKKNDFLRYRTLVGEPSELTIKKKLHKDCVSSRVEVNLLTQSTRPYIEEFVKLLGYEFDFSIYKYNDSWIFKDVTLVHYSVTSKGNFFKSEDFVEVELRDIKESLSKKYAYKILNTWEKLLKPFGITKKHRIDKSLFDLYRSGSKRGKIKKKINRAKNIS